MECGACLLDISSGLAAKHRPCGKFFHVSCLDRWETQDAYISGDEWEQRLENRHLCPHCRKVIRYRLDYEEIQEEVGVMVDDVEDRGDNGEDGEDREDDEGGDRVDWDNRGNDHDDDGAAQGGNVPAHAQGAGGGGRAPVYFGQQISPVMFMCRECGHPGFPTESMIAKHRETHEGAEQRTCPVCHTVFRKRSSMNRHYQNFH